MIGEVGVDYVGFTTGERRDDARVVVLIEATLGEARNDRSAKSTESRMRRVCEYWTLGPRDGLFTVLEIEERSAGAHHLTEPIGAPAAAVE